MTPPFGALRFLYVGTTDFDHDLAFYLDQLGAERVWQFARFGALVAALRLGDGPLLLLADHRPAPSCLPVYEVADLGATIRELRARGWQPQGARFEIPNGPVADPPICAPPNDTRRASHCFRSEVHAGSQRVWLRVRRTSNDGRRRRRRRRGVHRHDRRRRPRAHGPRSRSAYDRPRWRH